MPEILADALTVETKCYPSLTTPAASDYVNIRHPGCPQLTNILVSFRRRDLSLDGSHGVHYETARIACGIITGNKWQGVFTLDLAGNNFVDADPDAVLVQSNYYFWPTADRIPSYSIVPSFDRWAFPHQDLPPTWVNAWTNSQDGRKPVTHSQLSGQVRARDVTCRLSAYDSSLETAHLVPVAESEWFKDNSMKNYARDMIAQVYDEANAILLRSDIHKQFDSKNIVFVPKKSAVVAHVIGESEAYAGEFHNTELGCLCGVSKEYILTRFAWAIFTSVLPFILDRKNEAVGLLVSDRLGTRTVLPNDPEFGSFMPDRTRTPSPKKRGRAGAEGSDISHARGPSTFCPVSRQPRSAEHEKRGRSIPGETTIDNIACEQLVKQTRLSSETRTPAITTQSSFSAASSRTSDQHQIRLKTEALKWERERSDTDGSWASAILWRNRVVQEEETLDQQGVRALMWVNGNEDLSWEETLLEAESRVGR